MLRILVLIGLFFLNYSILYASENVFYDGTRFFQIKYYQEIIDYSKFIELNPRNAEMYYKLGFVYGILGNSDQAILNFNKAIDLDPLYAQAYYERGNCKNQQNDAIFDYTKAIDINPKYLEAFTSRGWAYTTLGNNLQAISEFTIAITINPKYESAYIGRGIANDQQMRYPQAIADFTKAIEINPKNAWVYQFRGNVYFENFSYSQAILDYTKAIETNPDFLSAYANRGHLYEKQGDFDKAISDYNKIIEAYPNPDDEMSFRRRKNLPKTIHDKSDYYYGLDQGINVYEALKILYVNKNKFTSSDYNSNHSSSLDPDQWSSKAIAFLTKAIESNSKDAKAYFARGLAYDNRALFMRATSDYNAMALLDYNRAIELNPNFSEAYLKRGLFYKNHHRINQAIDDFTKAIGINSNNAEAFYERGISYYLGGQKEKALLDVHKAEELGVWINSNFSDLNIKASGLDITKLSCLKEKNGLGHSEGTGQRGVTRPDSVVS